MIIHFHGVVQLGDDGYRCAINGVHGSIFIDGIDVISTLAALKEVDKLPHKATVAILDERFEGNLETGMGWGYSEVTAEETDSLFVGEGTKHNLIDRISALEYQRISIVIADEPVNLLDLPPRLAPTKEDYARMAEMLLRDKKEQWFDLRPYVKDYNTVIELLVEPLGP